MTTSDRAPPGEGDTSDLETRIRELEVSLRRLRPFPKSSTREDEDTNGCTYGCTHGCTDGCTGTACSGKTKQ